VSVRLAPGDDAAALGLLEVAPGIGARWVEQGELDAFVDANASRRPWLSPPLHPVMDRSGALWTRAAAAHVEGRRGKGTVVGIIDTGLDVNHADLRTADGKTRVAWMLDLASKPKGLHPELEKQFGCSDDQQAPCAVYSGEDIDALVAAGDRSINDLVGHGTHVASIAAGGGGKEGRFVGLAPEASLVVVRVTRQGGGDAITDVDILNSVRFVFERAEELGMPAVVNVSLGGDYGPHDGTSPLEQGLASMVGQAHPGRSIVVAAGNSAGIINDAATGRQFGAHTEARVLPGSKTRVVLTAPSPSLAVKGSAYVWITMQRGDEVTVGLERNGDEALRAMSPGEQGAVEAVDGASPYMAIINGVLAENSPLSPGTTGAVVAISGDYNAADRFAIVLEGQGTAQLWVQGTGAAEYGSTTGGELFLSPLKQGTVNVPATHPDLIAVGCTINRLDWPDVKGDSIAVRSVGSLVDPPGDSACYFSGAGPNALGVSKPEISAPGGFVVAAMSSGADPKTSAHSMFLSPSGRCDDPAACYVVDATHAVASGTSMSAPHVTGAVALLLEQAPKLTQAEIVAVLQGGARRFQGVVPYEFQAGPGALDIEGSLQVLAEASLSGTGKPRGLAPDAKSSWLQLSSGFARPDGAFPVVGNVMLRAADGGPATATDVAKLSVELENGELVAGPSAPAGGGIPGVYRFQVVAPVGSGGQQMSVIVRYDGEEVGRRTLPIGVDLWATQGVPVPRGGCASAPGVGLAGGLAGGLAAGLSAASGLWAALRARRARRARRAARARQARGAGDGPEVLPAGSSPGLGRLGVDVDRPAVGLVGGLVDLERVIEGDLAGAGADDEQAGGAVELEHLLVGGVDAALVGHVDARDLLAVGADPDEGPVHGDGVLPGCMKVQGGVLGGARQVDPEEHRAGGLERGVGDAPGERAVGPGRVEARAAEGAQACCLGEMLPVVAIAHEGPGDREIDEHVVEGLLLPPGRAGHHQEEIRVVPDTRRRERGALLAGVPQRGQQRARGAAAEGAVEVPGQQRRGERVVGRHRGDARELGVRLGVIDGVEHLQVAPRRHHREVGGAAGEGAPRRAAVDGREHRRRHHPVDGRRPAAAGPQPPLDQAEGRRPVDGEVRGRLEAHPVRRAALERGQVDIERRRAPAVSIRKRRRQPGLPVERRHRPLGQGQRLERPRPICLGRGVHAHRPLERADPELHPRRRWPRHLGPEEPARRPDLPRRRDVVRQRRRTGVRGAGRGRGGEGGGGGGGGGGGRSARFGLGRRAPGRRSRRRGLCAEQEGSGQGGRGDREEKGGAHGWGLGHAGHQGSSRRPERKKLVYLTSLDKRP
jgi:subtilisin family serine protease